MQFSNILGKNIQLNKKWCLHAEIWSRSSQILEIINDLDINKSLQ